MSYRQLAAALALAASAAGCPRVDPCDADSQKRDVLATVLDWYLFPTLLPATVDLSSYDTPEALLDALTAGARAQGMDRHWSYLTSLQASQQYFGAGQSVGFGFILLARNADTQLFVGRAISGSAAADAGFARGDEILRIGDTAQTLVPVQTLLTPPSSISDAIGPATAGVTRVFEVKDASGTVGLRTVTKRVYDVDPVPAHAVIQRAAPLPPVGYVALGTFVSTAETPLRQAFQDFRDHGVSDLVVDVRYNGGGLIATAELLGDLLGGARLGVDPMYTIALNPAHAALDATAYYSPAPQAVSPARVAFVTTQSSASASELVPNVVDPYLQVALVGDRTYGKPVGQIQFQNTQCGTALFLIAFSLPNRDGNSGYYGGLPNPPGFHGVLCQAPDDLLHAMEDPAEASTAAALSWLETGTCPAPPPGAPLRMAPGTPLRASHPTPAQVDMPGLF